MDETTIMISVGGGMALLVYLTTLFLSNRGDAKLRDRLKGNGKFAATAAAAAKAEEKKVSVKDMIQRVGQMASAPFMPKTQEAQGDLRRNLARAGIYAPAAFRAMTGGKMVSMGAGAALGVGLAYWKDLDMSLAIVAIAMGGVIGYIGPTFWLKIQIKSNQRALTEGLADALDLMVVCVEAGLTVDGAMQRVATELALAHPSLARELNISHMETRVGLSRAESLKNLGVRTGNAALKSLATMLIQADRFGTSVATALRVHSDTLRTNRQFAAEESAAKASVKLTFPLVLFIFPATFIVLAGPTAVQLMESDLMK